MTSTPRNIRINGTTVFPSSSCRKSQTIFMRTRRWEGLDPADRPDQWDDRIPILVMPEEPDDFHARLGEWLKTHVPRRRNTIRFLIPKSGSQNAFLDRDLIIQI